MSIAELVQKYIDENPVAGITLRVVTEGVRQDRDWTYVPVMPDHQPASRFPYYEALARLETRIQMEQGQTILLIPVTPDEPALVSAG